MYIRIGETEAIVVNVVRSPSGGIARVKAKSAKFTPANIGGIAINDNNETLGIVSAVEGSEATIGPLNRFAWRLSALLREKPVFLGPGLVLAANQSAPRHWNGFCAMAGNWIGPVPLAKSARELC